ncbi:MAG: WbqC family protein [Elusimicrobia bacterium]|nr:WbqC family protein [Elusimicrobiota bacterium]
MVISVHQPQYLPWLGYLHKISKSDAFVYLDNVQYKKREFQNRNRIRTKEGWIWLTVPVITKGKYHQKIFEVGIDNDDLWCNSHWESIKLNYSKAEHFSEHRDFFENIYSNKWEKLIDLNIKIIGYLLKVFEIKTPVYYESKLGTTETSTDRIIQICKKLNADEYLSGRGGKDYMEENKFEESGIKLIWQEFKHPEYKQVYDGFQPYMSAVDLLFNHGPESIGILKNSD